MRYPQPGACGLEPDPRRYDDGGFSGGSTDRPALQQLLADIKARKVDVIVVYKVDRLTRSLADFAKLVELFDAHGVSFVSVTQQFNTTTSMGRLTLNVLLSFAQFEREVTSERIRDKIAASKRKGLWVGGMVAARLSRQGPEDHRRGGRGQGRPPHLPTLSRTRQSQSVADRFENGRDHDQVRPLSRRTEPSAASRSRAGRWHTFCATAFTLARSGSRERPSQGSSPQSSTGSCSTRSRRSSIEQRTHQTKARHSSKSPLTGRIFDDRGNRMTPTYATKNGVRYRYYVSSALFQGRAKRGWASSSGYRRPKSRH